MGYRINERNTGNWSLDSEPKHVRTNGFGLGEGGELEALSFVLAPKFDRSTKVQFTTEPPLLPSPCYAYVPTYLR